MRKLASLSVAACLLSVPVASANDNPYSLGVTGGTLGFGVEAGYDLSPRFRVRALAAGLNMSEDFEAEGNNDLDYDGDLELRNAAALLDFHPFSGTFRLTAGLVISDNEVDGSATCEQLFCDFGDGSNVLVQGDRVDASAESSGTTPYLGLGWGAKPSTAGQWGFTVDIGAFVLKDPDVDVEISGPSSGVPGAEQEAQNEEDRIEDDLDDIGVYPVLMVGAAYRF